MKGNFRTLLKKFCLSGSISGIKYFYLYPDPISRCYWLITMVGSLYLAVYLSVVLYLRFQHNPTRITIENQYTSVINISYPAITICSPNQITISSVQHFDKTFVDGQENVTFNLEKVVPQLVGFYEPFSGINQFEMQQLQTLIDLNRYTISEIMSMLPQTCEDFLKICYFKGKTYEHCRDLFVPLLTTHGLCCAFNNKYYLDKRKNKEKIDFVEQKVMSLQANELTVIADYNPADAVDGTIINAGGIRIMVTDWSEFPSDDVSSVVPTYTETYNVIQTIHTYCSNDVKVLPQQSRKCNLLNEGSLRFFNEYHNSDCDHLCVVSAVEAACDCTPFYVPNFPSLSKACNATKVDCITKVKLNMHKWKSPECECPGDCESRRYKVDHSIGNLNALSHLIYDIYPGVTFNKSTAVMNFMIYNSVYVKQKQETIMSFISLVSNLGGVFGLCMGISALSVVEIFFFIYVYVRNKVETRKRRKMRRGNFTD